MRSIGRWAGVPACFMLTILRRIGDIFRSSSKEQPVPGKILVIKLAEHGATVLAYPALKRAEAMAGPGNVYFLVFDKNRAVLDELDVIPRENVLVLPTGGVIALLFGTLKMLIRIRRLHIDTALDFEVFARRSAVLAYLSGAKTRIGFHSFSGEAHYRGDLMTHRLSYNPRMHASDIYDVMVRTASLPSASLPTLDMQDTGSADDLPEFKPEAGELDALRLKLKKETGWDGGGPLVLLSVNASDPLSLRRWESDRYVELAKRLLGQSSGVSIAFTGEPSEVAATEVICESVGSDRCFLFAGKTSYRELLAMYCIADVLVTSDGGPAHFAAMTPIQVITLLGPESPEVFGARTVRNRSIWKKVPCSPCVNAFNDRISSCSNNVCMQRITVDEVFDAVCSICPL